LEGDRGQCLVLALNGHTFLGLYGLVQTIRPTSTRHETSGELIDDDDFVVAYDIVHIAAKEMMGTQGRHNMMHEHDLTGFIKACARLNEASLYQHLFYMMMPFF